MAAPPLFMAVLLTTRPRESLALRRPSLGSLVAAVALSLLLLLPLVQLTQFVLSQYPAIKDLLDQNQPLTEELRRLRPDADGVDGAFLGRVGIYLLFLGVLPAVCEELAFRGFILTGLLRRFRPATAIVISSFLFAVMHMNVFQFLPTLVLGLLLGTLTWRGGSVVPAMLFHLLHNSLLVLISALAQVEGAAEVTPPGPMVSFVLQALCLIVAFLVLWRVLRRPAPSPVA
jgi:sodium transport system permease protein